MGLRTRWTTAAAVMVMGVVGVAPAHAGGNPPVAVPDTASTIVGTSVVVNPLANDTDAELEPLTLDATLILQSGAATVAVVGAGPEVAITPTSLSQVVVAYTVVDASGASALGTITVDVLPPPNQAPLAAPDVAQMYSGGQLQVDPRTNDSDPDGEALTVSSPAVTSGAGTVTTDGQVLVIGAAVGYVGPLVVTYVVSDPRGGQAQSTVTVDVITAPNRPPVAVPDAVSVKAGRTYRIAVLANDSDPDGDRLAPGEGREGQARDAAALGLEDRLPRAEVVDRHHQRPLHGAGCNGCEQRTGRSRSLSSAAPLPPSPSPSRSPSPNRPLPGTCRPRPPSSPHWPAWACPREARTVTTTLAPAARFAPGGLSPGAP